MVVAHIFLLSLSSKEKSVFMRKILLILLSLGLLMACNQKTENATPSVVSGNEDIRLAVLPIVDCLPFYYAEKMGLYDSLGLHLKLCPFEAQNDCDTALLGGSVDGSFMDAERFAFHQKRGVALVREMQTEGDWALLSSGTLRIKKMKDLDNRVLGLPQRTTENLLADQALRQAGMKPTALVRVQVNSYRTCASMLENNQLDAAVLPEPFATEARLLGARQMYEARGAEKSRGMIVFRSKYIADKSHAKFLELLRRGYNQAVDSLNRHGVKCCLPLLLTHYKISQQVADSLHLPHYSHVRATK